MTFLGRIQSGVAVVNGGTYGSEPHMPFGGLRQSGNGWREAGTQALDVYSDLKTIYINHNPSRSDAGFQVPFRGVALIPAPSSARLQARAGQERPGRSAAIR